LPHSRDWLVRTMLSKYADKINKEKQKNAKQRFVKSK